MILKIIKTAMKSFIEHESAFLMNWLSKNDVIR